MAELILINNLEKFLILNFLEIYFPFVYPDGLSFFHFQPSLHISLIVFFGFQFNVFKASLLSATRYWTSPNLRGENLKGILILLDSSKILINSKTDVPAPVPIFRSIQLGSFENKNYKALIWASARSITWI